jgi:hypothetical protein
MNIVFILFSLYSLITGVMTYKYKDEVQGLFYIILWTISFLIICTSFF